MVSESYSWCFLIDAQVRNCDGMGGSKLIIKSLFNPLKLESIKWFRDEFWDIYSATEWHLLQLTWWFFRKIKRPAYCKYWNINNLKVSLELGHIFSFGRDNLSSWKDYGYCFLFKKTLSILEKTWRSDLFQEKTCKILFELINAFMISSDNKWIIELFSWGGKILDVNWPQGDNGELTISVSDC